MILTNNNNNNNLWLVQHSRRAIAPVQQGQNHSDNNQDELAGQLPSGFGRLAENKRRL